jgi:DnaK suppressor protein
MSMADPAVSLRDVQERTAQRVAELMEVFDAIVQSSAVTGPDAEHDGEDAVAGFDRAQLSSIVEHARAQLAEINDTLERLRGGRDG